MSGMAEFETLSPRQQRGLIALLTQPSVQRAAADCRCSEKTLRRWLQQPAFQHAYHQFQRQSVELALGQCQEASGQAITVLRAIMLSPKSPASSRVQAARVLLETALKGIEQQDFSDQLKALETQILQLGTLPYTPPPQTSNGQAPHLEEPMG
jgi:hypothetical protein